MVFSGPVVGIGDFSLGILCIFQASWATTATLAGTSTIAGAWNSSTVFVVADGHMPGMFSFLPSTGQHYNLGEHVLVQHLLFEELESGRWLTILAIHQDEPGTLLLRALLQGTFSTNGGWMANLGVGGATQPLRLPKLQFHLRRCRIATCRQRAAATEKWVWGMA